jgi:hypothetical protein
MLTAGFSSFRGSPSLFKNDRLVRLAQPQDTLDSEFELAKRRRTCLSACIASADDDPFAPTHIAKFARNREQAEWRMDTGIVPSICGAPTTDYSSPLSHGISLHQEIEIRSENDPLHPTPRYTRTTERSDWKVDYASAADIRVPPTIEYSSPYGRVTSPQQDHSTNSSCYDADTEDQVENWVSCEDLESLQRTGIGSLAQTSYQAITTIPFPTGADRSSSPTWLGDHLDSCTTESDCDVLELLEDITAPCAAAAMKSPGRRTTAINTSRLPPYEYPPSATSGVYPAKKVVGGPEVNKKVQSITVNHSGSQHQYHHPWLYAKKEETILKQDPTQSSLKGVILGQGHKSDSSKEPTFTFNCIDVLMNSRQCDRPT